MRPVQFGLRIALAAMLAMAVAANPAGAQTDISIEFDELVFGKPGSVTPVTEVEVDPDMVGKICLLEVHAENQASVHPGNDLIVSTGTAQAVVVGVEDTPNGGTDQAYNMVLGPKITVQLRIGPDGMSSLGFGLSFDCAPGAANTETPTLGQQVTESSTTTAAPTTTVAPTTTAAPTTAAPSTAAPTVPPTVASTTTAAPTVAGQVTNGLPETPAANAVVRAPAYTG